LHQVAAHGHERFGLGHGFHAFGQGRFLEALGHENHTFHNRPVAVVLQHVADETLVDLDHVDRQGAQVSQG